MFYFACETKEELNKWLNAVMQSATATHSFDGAQSHREASLVAKGNLEFKKKYINRFQLHTLQTFF